MMLVSFAACKGDEVEETTTELATEITTEDLSSVETTVEPGTETTVGTSETPSNNETTAPPTGVTVPQGNEAILAAYTNVINKAKAAKVGFTKKEFQSVPDNATDRNIKSGKTVVNTLLSLAKSIFKTEDKAETEVKDKGSDMKWFPVPKNEKGNYLTDVSFIKSAEAKQLANGNIEIKIVLKDEQDSQPTPENSGAPLSKVGSMFYPIPVEDVQKTLKDPTVSKIIKDASAVVLYKDSTAIIEYNPANDQLVKIDHLLTGALTLKGKAIIGGEFEVIQNVYNTMKIWDIKY